MAQDRNSLGRWHPRDLFLLARAIPLVIWGSMLQKWVPIMKWGHLLGRAGPVPSSLRALSNIPAAPGEVLEISKSVARACTILPWTPTCLAKAFAGQRLLLAEGRPGVVVIGLKLGDNNRWPAHAWLISEDKILTGGEVSDQYFPASAHTFCESAAKSSSHKKKP